jgi:hypothetical protein
MADYEGKIIGNRQATGSAAAGGVTVTITGTTGQRLSVCGIQCSGDAAALVTVESPAATVLYRKRFAGAFVLAEDWEPGELLGASGADLLVKISASTSNCEANIQAAQLPG